MTDALTFSNTDVAGSSRRASGYQAEAVREVQARAANTDQKQSDAERRGLRRLNQILDNNQPLRDDVPRGYHLNIKV